jgi:hypothetical protein
LKIAVLLLAILLAGCTTTQPAPIRQAWPNVDKNNLIACPNLKEVPETNTSLTDMLLVVQDNYGQYYTCKDRVDAWIKWYNSQKKNFME